MAIANLDEKKYTELDQSTKVCNFSTLCFPLFVEFEKRPKSYIRYQQRCPRSVLSNRGLQLKKQSNTLKRLSPNTTTKQERLHTAEKKQLKRNTMKFGST
uniref:Uncharacterized protein orf99e n=1 Tax=Beta vulgaris subsp. maritima TaxID=350892 RepID=F4MKW8_BETVM|nr:hypothetical protein [Beta vulgaris subsp. maritima]